MLQHKHLSHFCQKESKHNLSCAEEASEMWLKAPDKPKPNHQILTHQKTALNTIQMRSDSAKRKVFGVQNE